jgi:hypothetical protein
MSALERTLGAPRAGNFDTTREPDTKLAGLSLCLTGLGHKRVDPFTTRLSCLNGSCRGSPAGDLPDPFMFFFFYYYFFT